MALLRRAEAADAAAEGDAVVPPCSPADLVPVGSTEMTPTDGSDSSRVGYLCMLTGDAVSRLYQKQGHCLSAAAVAEGMAAVGLDAKERLPSGCVTVCALLRPLAAALHAAGGRLPARAAARAILRSLDLQGSPAAAASKLQQSCAARYRGAFGRRWRGGSVDRSLVLSYVCFVRELGEQAAAAMFLGCISDFEPQDWLFHAEVLRALRSDADVLHPRNTEQGGLARVLAAQDRRGLRAVAGAILPPDGGTVEWCHGGKTVTGQVTFEPDGRVSSSWSNDHGTWWQGDGFVWWQPPSTVGYGLEYPMDAGGRLRLHKLQPGERAPKDSALWLDLIAPDRFPRTRARLMPPETVTKETAQVRNAAGRLHTYQTLPFVSCYEGVVDVERTNLRFCVCNGIVFLQGQLVVHEDPRAGECLVATLPAGARPKHKVTTDVARAAADGYRGGAGKHMPAVEQRVQLRVAPNGGLWLTERCCADVCTVWLAASRTEEEPLPSYPVPPSGFGAQVLVSVADGLAFVSGRLTHDSIKTQPGQPQRAEAEAPVRITTLPPRARPRCPASFLEATLRPGGPRAPVLCCMPDGSATLHPQRACEVRAVYRAGSDIEAEWTPLSTRIPQVDVDVFLAVRTGIAHLQGTVRFKGDSVGAEGQPLFELPASAAPTVMLSSLQPSSGPCDARLTVWPDGKVFVSTQPGALVSLGVTWLADIGACSPGRSDGALDMLETKRLSAVRASLLRCIESDSGDLNILPCTEADLEPNGDMQQSRGGYLCSYTAAAAARLFRKEGHCVSPAAVTEGLAAVGLDASDRLPNSCVSVCALLRPLAAALHAAGGRLPARAAARAILRSLDLQGSPAAAASKLQQSCAARYRGAFGRRWRGGSVDRSLVLSYVCFVRELEPAQVVDAFSICVQDFDPQEWRIHAAALFDLQGDVGIAALEHAPPEHRLEALDAALESQTRRTVRDLAGLILPPSGATVEWCHDGRTVTGQVTFEPDGRVSSSWSRDHGTWWQGDGFVWWQPPSTSGYGRDYRAEMPVGDEAKASSVLGTECSFRLHKLQRDGQDLLLIQPARQPPTRGRIMAPDVLTRAARGLAVAAAGLGVRWQPIQLVPSFAALVDQAATEARLIVRSGIAYLQGSLRLRPGLQTNRAGMLVATLPAGSHPTSKVTAQQAVLSEGGRHVQVWLSTNGGLWMDEFESVCFALSWSVDPRICEVSQLPSEPVPPDGLGAVVSCSIGPDGVVRLDGVLDHSDDGDGEVLISTLPPLHRPHLPVSYLQCPHTADPAPMLCIRSDGSITLSPQRACDLHAAFRPEHRDVSWSSIELQHVAAKSAVWLSISKGVAHLQGHVSLSSGSRAVVACLPPDARPPTPLAVLLQHGVARLGVDGALEVECSSESTQLQITFMTGEGSEDGPERSEEGEAAARVALLRVATRAELGRRGGVPLRLQDLAELEAAATAALPQPAAGGSWLRAVSTDAALCEEIEAALAAGLRSMSPSSS
eukprot:TRINITY_DN12502_c0_g3_i2.p1 TRINITY_DN12502_c0_g3~~TRINITY_DN12502_c0_g3_i2.p1  ORF type:complete len:1570 (+),score=588.66 TRINITY_DN12502_c0_g3_i2:236-4711(+)